MEKVCLSCRFYRRDGERPGVCTNINSPDFDRLVWDHKCTAGHWEPLEEIEDQKLLESSVEK